MGKASAIDFFKNASDEPSASVCDADVKLELLRRAIESLVMNRLPILIPLAVISVAAVNIPQRAFLWALALSFLTVTVLAAIAAGKVGLAIAAEKPPRRAISLWLAIEFVGAAIWGLMLGPISDSSLIGPERAVITAVIMVAIATSCLVTRNSLGMPKAIIAGFMATAFPVFAYHYAENGAVMLVSSFLMLLALIHLVSKAQKEAIRSLKNELENTRLAKNLAKALDAAQYLSRHDSLTGLLNRRHFEAVANKLSAENSRSRMAIIMIDLDHFKSVNDKFGHAVGDEVLKTAAEIIKSSVRSQNISVGKDEAMARWGGEEFVIALAGTDLDEATLVAGRICQALCEYRDASWPDGLTLTGSLGVAEWNKTEALNETIDRADLAMFDAKAAGRNQIKTAKRSNKASAANVVTGS